jgi:hypothetical protein
MAVLTYVGCSELTRTFAAAYSAATSLVIVRTAPLLARYRVWPVTPTSPAIEERLTIAPPPASAICGAVCFMPRKVPVTLTAMSPFQSSTRVSASGAMMWMPALLTSTSIGPLIARAWSVTRAHSSSLVTSCAKNSALPPAALIFSTTDFPAGSSMSVAITVAPSPANRTAAPTPMPFAAPVMRMILSWRRDLLELLVREWRCGVVRQTLRWRRARAAAWAPHIPCAPGPGGVAAEHR